ncbi:hydantoinase/oxoprolinase family protein [Desulfovibrio inopinatus]|uniref:hydantoinase/oxoprolinase family protein n=1 Tax=Desulfovibrio inopinatus TaxID=102109 RepID=UPI00041ECE22|nr:hydantoinase/oxoprolinase family protein [Desulfovibrio inopinatus]
MLLGIDVGGTHTDAVLVSKNGIVASAKIRTRHDDLLSSINDALSAVLSDTPASAVTRLNLSTTLSTNSIVEGRTEPVGVFVTGGPGIDPEEYRIFSHYYPITGVIDHRGEETGALDMAAIERGLEQCRQDGVKVFAGIGKFSVRNPEHEQKIKEAVHPTADFVSLGHEFSGQLGFGRRIATAAYNCAVWRLYNRFADAVQSSAVKLGLQAKINILKADGGVMPLSLSRSMPVESILSGPAASVMGIIAVCDVNHDSVILDIGGTTTDIAVFADGAPLIETEGIAIGDRPTLVRALKTRSIGIGGDSAVHIENDRVLVGPKRLGPAVAEGGETPTLLDALNVLDLASHGDVDASLKAMDTLAREHGLEATVLADYAVSYAVNRIREEVASFLQEINAKPVYTIFELLEGKVISPQQIYIMGGPAKAMTEPLSDAFTQTLVVPEYYSVANAIGAALSRPTMSAELFADTDQGRMVIPSLHVTTDVSRSYSLEQAKLDVAEHLREHLDVVEMEDAGAFIEVTSASSFNMVSGMYTTGRNIRVKCQVRPGIVDDFKQAVTCAC